MTPEMSLDDALGNVGETFQQRLLHLIDDKGLTDGGSFLRNTGVAYGGVQGRLPMESRA